MCENFINGISTKVIETRDEFIFQTISSWIVDNYQITVSKETLSKAVALENIENSRSSDNRCDWCVSMVQFLQKLCVNRG